MTVFTESFKLLHRQAGFQDRGVNDETLKKFGDLVVQECVKITLQSPTSYQAAERIREYFKQ